MLYQNSNDPAPRGIAFEPSTASNSHYSHVTLPGNDVSDLTNGAVFVTGVFG
jgi:hypothetical protein